MEKNTYPHEAKIREVYRTLNAVVPEGEDPEEDVMALCQLFESLSEEEE